jgi:hypothetical protein
MHLSLESIVGAATIFFGILVQVIGIPDQIRQNFARKSTEGVSLANQSVGFVAYFFWTFTDFSVTIRCSFTDKRLA